MVAHPGAPVGTGDEQWGLTRRGGHAAGPEFLRGVVNAPIPVEARSDSAGDPTMLLLPEGPAFLRVERVEERWRLDDEWWRERAIGRLYFRVVLVGGRTVTVYRDLVDGGWFAQRYGRRPGRPPEMKRRRRPTAPPRGSPSDPV